MTDQQRRNVLGLTEKKNYIPPHLEFARQVREATARGNEILATEQAAIKHDVANRKRLGVQPPLHVRTAEVAAKIARGEMASTDHSKWGQYSPLKPKNS